MEKIFNSFDELLEFDFSKLGPCSNYFAFVPQDGVLPKLRNLRAWRIVGNSKSKPRVDLEITPRWVTITIDNGKMLRREDFQCIKRNPSDILRELFEGNLWLSEGSFAWLFL